MLEVFTQTHLRACPGRHFAEATVFVVISAVLHAYKIEPPLDEHGNHVDLLNTVKMTSGVISLVFPLFSDLNLSSTDQSLTRTSCSYPEPFDCIIKPRSPAMEALIRTTCKLNNDERVVVA